MSWVILNSSVVGTLHLEENIPCQDSSQFTILEDRDILIGAIADGAGSAEYSDIGSKTVINSTIVFLENHIDQLIKLFFLLIDYTSEVKYLISIKINSLLFFNYQNNVYLSSCNFLMDLNRNLFQFFLQELYADLNEQARIYDCKVEDFASTLISFIASPQWILSLQVGDGFLVSRPENENNYNFLSTPFKGEFINETVFITSRKVDEYLQILFKFQKSKFICLATDGLEEVAIQYRDWKPFSPFFRSVEEFIEDYSSECNDTKNIHIINMIKLEYLKRLEDFLNSDRLNKCTFDDKTLFICFYT